MSLSRLERSPPTPLQGPESLTSSASSPMREASAREASAPPPSTPFARVLRGLGRELDAGERATHAAMASARSGRDFSSIELIALQSQIYRYSEAVDLATKLVDRATNGLRTVVQGQ